MQLSPHTGTVSYYQSIHAWYFQWKKKKRTQMYSLHLCTVGTPLNRVKKCQSRHLVSCPNPYWGF